MENTQAVVTATHHTLIIVRCSESPFVNCLQEGWAAVLLTPALGLLEAGSAAAASHFKEVELFMAGSVRPCRVPLLSPTRLLGLLCVEPAVGLFVPASARAGCLSL